MSIAIPPEALRDVRESFFHELAEGLPRGRDAHARLEKEPSDRQALQELRAFFHRIAGTAAYVSFDVLGHLAAICEEAGDQVLDGTLSPAPWLVDLLGHGLDGVASALEAPGQTPPGLSTPPRGSAAAERRRGPTGETPAPHRSKILIIDDDPVSAKATGHFLRSVGFLTVDCTDATKALEVMQAELPDLVVLDVMMPGVDGFDLCRRVRADSALQFTPVIFVTRMRDVQQRVRGFEVGGDDYLGKPFEPEELVARVRGHLQRVAALREASSRFGKYEILRPLGAGGMAATFLAQLSGPEGFRKTVVIKRILPHLAADPEFLSLFVQEARLAARISHPNVVQIFQLGSEGGQYFIAMEYVEGWSLYALLGAAARHRILPPVEVACRIASDICGALQAAHAATDESGRSLDIVHRDVSPQNVLVSTTGAVKLADFGIAKAVGQAQITRSGHVRGKVAYQSPEQVRGDPVDARSDLFSLGIVFHECLTLRQLYRRSTDYRTHRAILHEPVLPPSWERPDVPPFVDEVCSRLLAKDVQSRVQTAAAAQAAVEAAIAALGRPVAAPAVSEWARAAMERAKSSEARSEPPSSDTLTATEPLR